MNSSLDVGKSSKWVYVTWRDNGKSSYNGKTHNILRDTIVEPADTTDLKIGQPVTVYWESDPRRKYWKAEIAGKKNEAAECSQSTSQKKADDTKKTTKTTKNKAVKKTKAPSVGADLEPPLKRSKVHQKQKCQMHTSPTHQLKG